MEFNIDPKDLNLQDAAGMQLVEVIRNLADESGTTDYEDLENLPKINGVTLKGDKSSDDLHIAVSDEQVTEAVDAWLEDNVAQETGYVLDSTLTMSNAAAPADKVGELKSALLLSTRNLFKGPWTQSAYNPDYQPTTHNLNTSTPLNIPVNGGQTYTASWGTQVYTGGSFVYLEEFDANGNRLAYPNARYSNGYLTATLHQDCVVVGFMIYAYDDNDDWEKLIPSWFQLESGSVATSYIPPEVINSDIINPDTLYPKIEKYVSNTVEQKKKYLVKSIAHRGDCVEAPQCTEPSYIAAKKNGFEIAENDLCLSADNEFVMWHDTSLSKLGNLSDINGYLMYTDGTDYYWVKNNVVYTWNGTTYVESAVSIGSLTRCAGSDYSVSTLSLSILKRIDFGSYKDEKFAGTQIMTFSEWVLLCKQLGMEIYVDPKITFTTTTLTNAINIVKKYGMAKYTSWLGLTWDNMTQLRQSIPDARIGIMHHPTSAYIQDYAAFNTGRGLFFNGDAKTDMTEESVQLGLNAGFDVEVWFVDATTYTEEQILQTIRTAVSYGVTAMTLDHIKVDDAFAYLLS